MNWSNALTLSRCVFAVIIAILLMQNALWANVIATVLFTIAAITDYYDGYLARTQGLESDFGKIMDPIADKFLMLTLFFVFAFIGMVDWWMAIVIAAREISVTASRLMAMRRGVVLAAERAGKIKTVVQITAISLVLLYLVAEQSQGISTLFLAIDQGWRLFIYLLMLVVVALTVWSGAMYFKHQGQAK